MAIARFVAQFAACLAVAAAIFASADLDAALPQDDVCEMSGGHECAISLRQLRAGGAPASSLNHGDGHGHSHGHGHDHEGHHMHMHPKEGDGHGDGHHGSHGSLGSHSSHGSHGIHGSHAHGHGQPYILASVSEDGAFDAGQQQREEDNSNGLPAGEPDYEAQVLNGTLQVDEPTATVHADLGLAGSCAKHGCHSHTSYHSGSRCQCSPACHKYRNCCGDYEAQCSAQPAKEGHYLGAVKIVYHATSKEAGHSILKHGFRLGSGGWCGGGIYFADSPGATKGKAIGPDSSQGFMIQARVAVGRVKVMSSTCDRSMSGPKLWATGFDSITFDPGDGVETVVYSANRVLSARAYR
eukprot:CAMPEP_0183396362 /NCGR_PEP_ID=MMETSP0370-20130417/9961_1 /TAXON_ID=268820 /ORGANISM="Peridinium aciculiferum, Strain PAER-2" /LENGTH=352 /DNA_ID=CAMNT_0025577139 /DNA_START=55 /DNA_END=1113 /DNA_ORIENTATION=+